MVMMLMMLFSKVNSNDLSLFPFNNPVISGNANVGADENFNAIPNTML